MKSKVNFRKAADITETVLTVCLIAITLCVSAFCLISKYTSDEHSLIYSTEYRNFNEGWKSVETGERVHVPNNGIKNVQNGLTVVNELPSDLTDSDYLHFYSCHEEFQIYIDGQLRYNYTLKDNAYLINMITAVSKNHFIKLSRADSGKEIEIHTDSRVKHWAGYLNGMKIGQKDAIMYTLVKENGIGILSGIVLFVIGVLFIFIFLIFHFAFRQQGLSLLYLSGFVLNVALWIVSESKLKDFYISNVSLCYPLIHTSLHMGTAFLVMFFNELQQNRYRKVYLPITLIITVLYIVNFTLQLTGKVDFITTLPFLHGMMGISAFAVIHTLFMDIKNKRAASWGNLVLIGFSLFTVFIVLEIFTLWAHFTQTRGIFTSLALISLTLMLGYTSIQGLIHNFFSQKNDLIQSKLHEQEMSEQFHAMQDRIIVGLAAAIDQRDENTGNHIENTKQYVKKLCQLLKIEGLYEDQVTDEDIVRIVRCAPLHDVGKIAVPDSILNKPGKLTKEEFEIMKTHTTKGGELLEKFNEGIKNEELDTAVAMSKYHHEHWDGTGYPEGLSGENIPLCARIMAVADVFDALRSARIYKPAFSFEESIEIMKEGMGTQFDPYILSLFLVHREEFRDIVRTE